MGVLIFDPFMVVVAVLVILFLDHGFVYSSSTSSNTSSPHHHLHLSDQSLALLGFRQTLFDRQSYYSYCSDLGILSWDNTTNCCTWDGIECDFTGKVISLDVDGGHCIKGTIGSNSTLFHLTHLQRLSLDSIEFENNGFLETLDKFPNLTRLRFSVVSGGDIPPEFGLLSKLVSLDLKYSGFRLSSQSFNLLLQNLTHLRELSLSHIQIGSVLPTNISSSLVHLDLSESGLSGKLPDTLFHLPNLRTLRLGDNLLTGPLPKIQQDNSCPLEVLDLSYNDDLSGEIADSIGQLKFLRYLDLSSCSFSGSIPKSIGNLWQLNFLDLSENKFCGQFPSVLSNLRNLSYLNVESNNFRGQFPSLPPKLIEVSIADNNLSGHFPSFAANMSQLEILNFRDNQMSGPIPFNISVLTKLKAIALSNNSFSGNLPSWLFTPPSLQFLDLHSNQFEGQIPESLSNSLGIIKLGNNKLSGTIPISISHLVNLTVLDLSSNKLSGKLDIAILSDLNSLTYIDLSHNLFEGPVPIPSPNAQIFDASNNKFHGGIPTSLCDSTELVVLDLSHNNLNGVIPKCVGNLSSLVMLDLQKNGFIGNIPPSLVRYSRLLTLNVNGNQLEGRLPLSLANHSRLKVLDLGNNLLSDSFPHWLERLEDLNVLILKSNKFHGSLRETNFSRLRILDVSDNGFTGHLPSTLLKILTAMIDASKQDLNEVMADFITQYEYKYIDSVTTGVKGQQVELVFVRIFTTIDLSSNKFQGEIPDVIGSLISLHLLNLSHNSLTGQIPRLLGNLSALESLDLSSNKLVGEIPRELISLDFLQVLNLSHNHLSGCIPQGRHFDTFGNDSYIGNSELRGLPLSKDCGDHQSRRQPLLPDSEPENDSTFAEGFTWKVVMMGYGSGAILGLIIGYIMMFTRKPRWLIRVVDAEEERILKRQKKKIHIDMWKKNKQSRR